MVRQLLQDVLGGIVLEGLHARLQLGVALGAMSAQRRELGGIVA